MSFVKRSLTHTKQLFRQSPAVNRAMDGLLECMPGLKRRMVRAAFRLDPGKRYQNQTHPALLAAPSNASTPRRLFVDVTIISKTDARTGVQRVVRAWLLGLLAAPLPGYRVEPVILTEEAGSWVCRHAREYRDRLLGKPVQADDGRNSIIDPLPGDIFLGLDLTMRGIIEAEWTGLFAQMQARGVRCYATVYDLLPVRAPEMFAAGSDISFALWLQAIARFDGAVCISKAVADDLRQWRAQAGHAEDDAYRIGHAHLGADLDNSAPTGEMPAHAATVLQALQGRPTFLMVGTLEPRKGHAQVLEAFECLWRQGRQVNLVIVGKRGWKIGPLARRLTHHPEKSRRLFWLEDASDAFLQNLYQAGDCLIAASYGEGFGLPLIEAAHHGLPLLVRDLPVFREVAGEHAQYFQAQNGRELAQAIDGWLDLSRLGMVPETLGIRWLTWEESTAALLEFLAEGSRSRTDLEASDAPNWV